MPSDFRTKINGRTWRVQFVEARAMGKDWGRCPHPPGRHPTLEIRRSLKGINMLDTLVHEVLHAQRVELDEQAVEETGSAIAKALWRAGYRLQEEA
jgi:hypothetical protein